MAPFARGLTVRILSRRLIFRIAPHLQAKKHIAKPPQTSGDGDISIDLPGEIRLTTLFADCLRSYRAPPSRGYPKKRGLKFLRPGVSTEALAVASDLPHFSVEASPISTSAFATHKDEFGKSPSRSNAIHWQSTDDRSCRWCSLQSRAQRISPSCPGWFICPKAGPEILFR